jgi:hypothetical protein
MQSTSKTELKHCERYAFLKLAYLGDWDHIAGRERRMKLPNYFESRPIFHDALAFEKAS